MRLKDNQKGASHLILVLAVAVFAVIGFAGYRVMNSSDTTETATETVQSSTDSAKITNKADVEQASKDIDATSLDAVDPSQLDSDLNSVL